MKKTSPMVSSLLVMVLFYLAALPASAQDLNFERARAKMVLDRVCHELEKNFYDPGMKGLDWKTLVADTRKRIDQATQPTDTYLPIVSLVHKLQDSHTVFVPPFTTGRPLFGFEAKAFGDEIRIYRLQPDGAAAAAGLQVGDRILGISGYKAERDTFDILMLNVIALRPQGAINMVFARGQEEPRQMRVEAKFKQEKTLTDLTKWDNIMDLIRESQSWMKEQKLNEFHYNMMEGDIGYLQLPTFSVAPDSLLDLAGKIKKARAVVIDLRNNRGGRVDALTAFAGAFERERTVIGSELMRGKTEPMKVKPQAPNLNVPMFILVDSQTASASEIFARHFQRTGRAVVIGDRTAGKVTVARNFSGAVGEQIVIFFGLEVGTARLVFPDGEELEKKGVIPDKLCIPMADDLYEKRDPCRSLAFALAGKAIDVSQKLPAN